MPVIDSDAHVIENEHTWDFMDPSDQRYRPEFIKPGERAALSLNDGKAWGWLIDGKIRGLAFAPATQEELAARSKETGRGMDAPNEARLFADVEARLRHMDKLGIDFQVVYPTIFIEQVADRPEVDVAICKSYNRWLAEIWKQGKGRIRWACVPPVLSMEESLEQVRFGNANGACGVLLRPIEGNRHLTDPYFYPLYEEASRLDLPITIHIGIANAEVCAALNPGGRSGGFWRFRLPTVGCFHALFASEVPEVFPSLRFAFVEAAAEWVPYALRDLDRRLKGGVGDRALREKRFYVTCQTDDDVPYVIKHAGEDSLLVGTDYGHTDQSSELEAHSVLRDKCGITEAQWRKIVDANPRAVYGI